MSIIERDCRDILSQVSLKKLKGKKVLITGANGFLGQYVAAALSHANRKLGLRCRIHTTGLHAPRAVLASVLRADKKITHKRVDLTKSFKLGGYDFIFHAAGYGQPSKFTSDPLSVTAINIDASRRLISSSPGATFVFFSSSEAYGDIPREKLPVREDFNGNCPLHRPRSVYAESKRLGESLCAYYDRTGAVRARIVRISAVYGPGLDSTDTRVMSEFIRKALTDKKITLLDGGGSVRTYGYIADVVAMILFAALHGREMVYNVGGTDKVSILDLARKIGRYCGVKVAVPAGRSRLAHIGQDPAVVRLDLGKIKREMKRSRATPFSEGLAREIEWHRELEQ
jgi:UDP-glucuronate decarboxylase